MSKYTNDSLVMVRSFDRREEGETATIGDPRRQVFLTIPAEALVILDCLAGGKTVGEARSSYQARFGDTPDVEDFLDALEPAGFVTLRAAGCDEHAPLPADESVDAASHLGWLSPSAARRLCALPVAVAGGVLVALAVALIATDPATVPGPTVLVFREYLAALSLGMFAFGLAGVAVHELAHLVAARAAGVPARIGVSHRLWIVVAETDMTGIWMAPTRARYRAFLAGPFVDAVCASFLIGVSWGHRRGWVGLTPLQAQVVGACLMVYLLRLLWQCFLFVRTDFYFVAATAFHCKNLMADTQDFLHNGLARVFPSWGTVDQTSIPSAEMRFVRWYSLVWLAGRAAAFCTLALVTLPVMWRYGVAIVPLLGGRSPYSVLDVVVLGLVTVGVDGAGLAMWIRALIRRTLERNSNEMARP